MLKFKKIITGSIIIGASYFVFTTLYFGYDDIDSEKGIYKFYWSGLRGLWEDGRAFGFKMDEIVETILNGVDGPYIIADSLFYVDKNNQLIRHKMDTSRIISVQTTFEQLPSFEVTIKDSITVEDDFYEMPRKLIAISDIEGNLTSLSSFLLANGVIDQNAQWIFGDGHLVLNGDFIDRGNQVAQVLWLIYSLEDQAKQQRGKVHFILGNHEIMNLYGDGSYNDFKYLEVAKRISNQNNWDTGLKYLYSEKSELGKWLRSKNIIERIGDIIFVHGGLNTHHLKGNYQLSEMNEISRRYNGILPIESNIQDKRDRAILSSINSPYWDRRLNFDLMYKVVYKLNGINAAETTESQLDSILHYFNASRIIIGHSVVDDIKADYNNRVIKIDVKHGRQFKSGETKGLMLENSIFYKLDDLGNKARLF